VSAPRMKRCPIQARFWLEWGCPYRLEGHDLGRADERSVVPALFSV
jgi:hypothetical protein